MFSIVVDPGPPEGARVFVRVFNKPTAAAATHWGQSACFTVNAPAVFAVGELGLWGTIIPKQDDPAGQDTDQDGATDLEEFIANTNAEDASDVLCLRSLSFPQAGAVSDMVVEARAGREYVLYRSTNSLLEVMQWTPVDQLGPLTESSLQSLQDHFPPSAPVVFYRLNVAVSSE
jgi:hypothetical protein